MADLSHKLQSILQDASSAALAEAESVKVASETTPVQISSEYAAGLVKVANLLRNVSSDPTYTELNSFIAELRNGHR